MYMSGLLQILGPCTLTQSVMKEPRKYDTDAVVCSHVTYVATGTGERPLTGFLTPVHRYKKVCSPLLPF